MWFLCLLMTPVLCRFSFLILDAGEASSWSTSALTSCCPCPGQKVTLLPPLPLWSSQVHLSCQKKLLFRGVLALFSTSLTSNLLLFHSRIASDPIFGGKIQQYVFLTIGTSSDPELDSASVINWEMVTGSDGWSSRRGRSELFMTLCV